MRGLGRVRRKLGLTVARINLTARAALREEGETIMSASKEIVPVDLGTLKSSGHVESEALPGRARVVLGYGGPAGSGENVGYALIVHEDLAAHHEHGQAKYLEVPFRAAQVGMAARLAAKIRIAT